MDKIVEDFISDPLKDILVICNTHTPYRRFELFVDNLRYRGVDFQIQKDSLSVCYNGSKIKFTMFNKSNYSHFVDTVRGKCFQMVYIDSWFDNEEEWVLKSVIRPRISWDEGESKDFVGSIGSRLVYFKDARKEYLEINI